METTHGSALEMPQKLAHYAELFSQIKLRIRQGQTRAVISANSGKAFGFGLMPLRIV